MLLGQSNGTLGTPVQIDSSLNPTGLAAGSLTTDGRTDLVVADQGAFNYVGSSQQINGALHVYLGNANGTFTTVTAPTTTATNYTVAALGDLNNDGKLDLIVAGNVAGTSAGTGTPNVYTLLGNGDGTFQAANTLALAGQDGIGATSIALADFNKDGDLDVVVGNPNDLTEVLFGNGDGTLIDTALALGQRPATVAAADLLGNGYPEILVGEAEYPGPGKQPDRLSKSANRLDDSSNHNHADRYRHSIPGQHHHRAVHHGHRHRQRRRCNPHRLGHADQRHLYLCGNHAHQRQRRHHRSRQLARHRNRHADGHLHARLEQLLNL